MLVPALVEAAFVVEHSALVAEVLVVGQVSDSVAPATGPLHSEALVVRVLPPSRQMFKSALVLADSLQVVA